MSELITDRWFNVDRADSEDCNFSDEWLVSCQLTKIFHYSEVRNAYWNTTSNLWPGDRAFHYSFDTVKNRIEEDRKMGSYFSIHEIPCLALKGTDDAVIIIDYYPRSESPLSFFKNIEKLKVDKLNIIEIFNYIKSQFPVYGFIMESKLVPSFESPLYTYSSYSSGSNYPLNFRKSTKSTDIQFMLNSLQFFHKLLSR
jgi:hypothetical protein